MSRIFAKAVVGKAAALVCLGLSLAGSAAAAPQARNIAGVVVDESGGAIEGARVSLTTPEGSVVAEASTNPSGRFSFVAVAAGGYVVRVEREQFRSSELPLSVTKDISALRITLSIATFSESVRVSYRSPTSSIGTKIDVPLTDIPQSIQVVPLAVLRDRGVTRVEQLVDTVSGVHAEPSYGSNAATFFSVRGFSTSSGLRDGFRDYGYVGARDVQAIDRVEVLKGPASVLYGATSSLGGYINTVSKQPLPTTFTNIGITATRYGVRPTADLNGRLNASGTLQGRANVAAEYNQTFRDDGRFGSFAFAPSLTWRPNERTEASAVVEYNYLSRQGFDFGLPNLPDASDLSRTRYYGLPEDYGRNHTFSATVASRRRLPAGWTWREAFHYAWARQNSFQSFPDTPGSAGSKVDLWTYPQSKETDRDWALQSELSGVLSTGPLRHQVLIGFEWAASETASAQNGSYDVDIVTIDLFDPRYRSAPSFFYENTQFRQPTNNQGLYLQDLIDVAPRLKALAGLRTDWLQTTAFNAGVESDHVTSSQPSPRIGLIWQPAASASLYGSWSRAFSPVAGRSATGDAFDPETGTQFEVGWKQQLSRLTATVAWFNLSRNGVLTLDPVDPLYFVQSGEQRSRGFEIDLAGESGTGLRWIASYAYTDAKVTSDNSFPVGDHLSNIPRHSGSLWSTYHLSNGRWRGAGVGAGVVVLGAREATLPNTFELSGFARVDVMASYGRGAWQLQLNGLNVLNQKYFVGGSAGTFNYTVNPSAPATVQVALTRRF
ncbi:MAG: TonB-dependent receptor [Acidobacteriota bacterium]